MPAMLLAASLGGFFANRPAVVSAEVPIASRAMVADGVAAAPRLTAPISTIVARAGGEVRILAVEAALPAADETRVRAGGALPMRILGTAASADAVARFVESLREHPFLGPVEVVEAATRPGGSFEIRVGDASEALFPRTRVGARGEVLATGGKR